MATSVIGHWAIDPSHSEVQFKVKHLVISTVTGYFRTFEGELTTENEDFGGANVRFSAQVESIDTNNAQRDGHLKSNDFFNAAEFPKLTFVSTSFKKIGETQFALVGDLTIREHTHAVALAVEHGGVVTDPWGHIKAGFELTGIISRQAFGLTWNVLTEAGGMVVGDAIKLIINIELVKTA